MKFSKFTGTSFIFTLNLLCFQSANADSCSEADNIQDSINSRVMVLQDKYPFSFAALKSCISKANTSEQANNCFITACTMAAAGATNTSEGCGDFSSRILEVAQRQNQLSLRKKNELKYCSFTVPSFLQ